MPGKMKKNIPFELFFGHKPSLEHLRVFGCVAFFYVPKQHHDKLEPRGEIGIMVGYARSRSGYRTYDIKNQRVIEERSVHYSLYSQLISLVDLVLCSRLIRLVVLDLYSWFCNQSR